MNLGVETAKIVADPDVKIGVSAFSDESWGGDLVAVIVAAKTVAFQHSLMNLGVETNLHQKIAYFGNQFQHSLMNLGVETKMGASSRRNTSRFQHSLMNLGVETAVAWRVRLGRQAVSAFSDESWGGDRLIASANRARAIVSAFSDESWGGDQ